ncbi:MAG TPA: hypothetical protein VIA62_00785 [Thermoanaerobaculia bacterium]|jgi:hypothetical protein|nr:hypothetical protein [Thermoanaerobaculia bacterium]
MSDWDTLGAVDPRALTDARLQLHWAAQAAAAVGKQLLPHQPDYGEQSFQWLAGPRALGQGIVDGTRPFRSAVRPSPAALLLLDENGATLAELPLEGRTLDAAYEWVRVEVERLLGRPLEKPLERPGEDFPANPVGSGAPFSTAAPACAEVGRYFADADRALRALAARNRGASPVRCWPHHFDIATLILLDSGADPEKARSIGVGLSPGDGAIAEPYFYVLPWPAPPTHALPGLAGGGRWQTVGWVGAVLEASSFTQAGSNGSQARRVEDFLDSAVAGGRRLLEEAKP